MLVVRPRVAVDLTALGSVTLVVLISTIALCVAPLEGPDGGAASLRLYVWGLNQSGRQERKLSEETFVALADFAGQYCAQILEGGTTVLPYGSQGFAFRRRWNGNQFENIGD